MLFRSRALGLTAAAGFLVLLGTLVLIDPADPGVDALLTVPTLALVLPARRRWLTVGELVLLATLPMLSGAAGTVQAVWEYRHSHDGLAVFSLFAAPLVAMCYASGGYLLAALIIFQRHRRDRSRAHSI